MVNATPNLDWQLSLHCSKWLTPSRNYQVLLRFTGVVDLDQWSKSTHAIFSRCCDALPLSPNLSLCLTLPLSCLLPHHDLPVFISYKNLMICMFDHHLIAIICLKTHRCFTWEIAYNNTNRWLIYWPNHALKTLLSNKEEDKHHFDNGYEATKGQIKKSPGQGDLRPYI